MSTLEERFWAKVRKTDGCWEWTGATNRHGYGHIASNYKYPKAHRLSWSWAFGEIPAGLFVCHHCDNRRCVRPDHLFLGTPRDNTLDMVAKGRGGTPPRMVGAAHPEARYPDEVVRAARQAYAEGRDTMRGIASRLGLAPNAVRSWCHGLTRLDAGGPISPQGSAS